MASATGQHRPPIEMAIDGHGGLDAFVTEVLLDHWQRQHGVDQPAGAAMAQCPADMYTQWVGHRGNCPDRPPR